MTSLPSIAGRDPHVSVEQMLADLVPPPHFADVRFDTYLPDPEHPSQAATVAVLQAFVDRIGQARPNGKRGFLRRSRVGVPPEERAGVYLDGGFGVGKSHLLASTWHATSSQNPESLCTYGTFVEYTNLVGALGFRTAVDALSRNVLVCIDEFELDDPGDTVLMSTLLGELVANGVQLVATSNTLPDKLGEGRFAADDFLREIQGLSAHFDVIRIEGEDYRHRGLDPAPGPRTDEEVRSAIAATPGATLDDFVVLEDHLARVHPSRYGAMLDGVTVVGLLGVRPAVDQARALRLVVLADRLYDRDIPVVASGMPLDAIFTPEMLRGGYRKKYYRALSRLVALARDGGLAAS